MNYTYNDHLQSNRLSTRFLTAEDTEAWSHFFKDQEAVQYFPDLGISDPAERATHWIQKQLGRYHEKRFGLQALIDKKTNEFVGQCGLLLQEVDEITEVEVGYHIFKKYWGQGYAPEAAKLFLNYAFQNKFTESVISIIDIRNTKSQRVAEKNNLAREKQTRWNNLDVFIYRITA
ncbi:MAG: GNAT family N-acetyltransferase [Bacteroidetes bacterium]|nr:GNAT family N-acetyltransferase [Bacteroidota bacterium]